MRYTDVWKDLTKQMGYWVDMDEPYVTYTSKYMESVWWLLKQLYDKNSFIKDTQSNLIPQKQEQDCLHTSSINPAVIKM